MLIFAVCSCKSESDKVKDFAGDFAQAITHANKDSVEMMYPDAAQADSLAPIHYSPDSIFVQKTPKKGVYKVYYSPDVFVTVRCGKDGDMHVVNSVGIFAIGKDLKRLALATGWIKDGMDDLESQQVLADTAFLDYLYSKVSNRLNTDVVVSDWTYDTPNGYSLSNIYATAVISLTVRNNTSMPLKGSNYYVTCKVYDAFDYIGTKRLNGVDVPAGGTAKISFNQRAYTSAYGLIGDCESTVHINVSKAEVIARYLQPTGHEYEEYKSRKS